MKFNILCLTAATSFIAAPALATIPGGSVISIATKAMGVYTTADPLCQTGFVATVPITGNPISIDLAKAPTIGRGPRAKGMQCIVFILNTGVSMSWAIGNYTTTTSGGSDNVCNNGGTMNTIICKAGGGGAVNWPAQILNDMSAAGLPTISTCTGSGNEIVPLYLSTAAACTGSSSIDPAACTGNNKSFQAPTGANDVAHGIIINSPPESGSYVFSINPSTAIGNVSGVCGAANAPLFAFRSR